MKRYLPKTLTDTLLVCLLIGLPALSLAGSIFFYGSSSNNAVAANTGTTTPEGPSPFDNLNISAKAAAVYDVNSGTFIYQKNANDVLPLASITKLMTTAVALDHAPTNTGVVITDAALAQDGDSGLLPGEQWNLLKLIEFTLVASSNDGAYAVAQAVQNLTPGTSFVDMMNMEAKSLGFYSMHFNNPTGLDESTTEAGGYASARDTARLFAYMIKTHPSVIDVTHDSSITLSSNQAAHTAENTDTVVNNIPGLIASKTGYTDLAGGNLAVVIDADPGRPLVLVALGSTYDGRFTDMVNLASSTYAYLALEK